MPIIAARTRQEIRVAIGRLLGQYMDGECTSGGTSTTLVDLHLRGGDDDINGHWIQFTGPSNNDGLQRLVTDYTGSSGTVTIQATSVALTTPATDDTFEVWESHYRPQLIHEFINQAIIDLYGLAFDPVEDITLHADGRQSRFDIPSTISIINKLERRDRVRSTSISTAGSAWTAGSNVTVTVDSELFKEGSGSNKIVMAAGVSAGDVIASEDFTSIDLSSYTHVEFWARCSKTTAAADFKLLLDDTSAAVSPLETLSFPILTKDTWQFVRLALANADDLTAIISVGVEDDVDVGAETLWVDGFRAVDNDSMTWAPIPTNHWSVDKSARDLVIKPYALASIGYTMLKISGGDVPVLLTADATANEVPDDYVIYKAAGLAGLAHGERQATTWLAMAESVKQSIDPIIDGRNVI